MENSGTSPAFPDFSGSELDIFDNEVSDDNGPISPISHGTEHGGSISGDDDQDDIDDSSNAPGPGGLTTVQNPFNSSFMGGGNNGGTSVSGGTNSLQESSGPISFATYLRVRTNEVDDPDHALEQHIILVVRENFRAFVDGPQGAYTSQDGSRRHSPIVFHVIRNEGSTSTTTIRVNQDDYTSNISDWERQLIRGENAELLRLTGREAENSALDLEEGGWGVAFETGTHVDVPREPWRFAPDENVDGNIPAEVNPVRIISMLVIISLCIVIIVMLLKGGSAGKLTFQS